MRRKKGKIKIPVIKTRVPIYEIMKKGGAHKSEKDYDRKKAKKELREMLKKIPR